ncbi:sulfatase-like hydrolase/transferase [candidate division KSB1 bacterium]|nr:sulfatase-like hydrolase/transferase [candidate division KSB1 bacterium]
MNFKSMKASVSMKRRDFMKLTGAGFAASLLPGCAKNSSSKKPNILLIITDQQFADGMSCVMGSDYINTPHMDALAKEGVRFARTYTPNPLCLPMRTSMFTGRFPHETGALNNGSPDIDADKHVFLGKIFKDAGYDTAYFGKWHIAFDENNRATHGFETFVGREAKSDPSFIVDYLKEPHERPFLAVASFLSPHEVCQWARKEEVPGGPIATVPPKDELPPLLPNFDPPKNETDIMTHMRKSYQAHRLFPVGDYTEEDWRRLRWGYYRLIERADRFVGTVVDALDEAGLKEDTLVIFMSDHGDCHGAHHWNQKTVFYDESARVPFIMRWPGHTAQGTQDVLVNTGTDMIPTLCDFAGIDIPANLPGKSLKAPAQGQTPDWQREFIVVENHMVQCRPVDGKDLKPQGRMVRSDRFKYCAYDLGTERESLVDMKNDPGEMVNLAKDENYRTILEQHRQYLADFCREYGDEFELPFA